MITAKVNDLERKLNLVIKFCLVGVMVALPFAKALVEIFVAISIGAWIVLKYIKREALLNNRMLFWVVLFFIFISCVSIFESGHLMTSLQGVVKLLKYTALMVVVADVLRDAVWFRRLLISGTIGFMLVAADTLFQEIMGYDLARQVAVQYTDTHARLSGPFRQYGILAA